ncbi:hypothetical protein AOL_s00006g261 [Orbilia oligospora ATCC 24927]|uniref:Nephrocystin 3-like N-terminal domain-containing protein n=1 Tax=Arthrobotrys oligospora (strain ATCC 24927 / CBS 115.81 / DSM 1491) TaxID=756982 RepID=G1X060_ARTOA|nr:hypothetical protein AOL_s00006g261 [Orbilia oligospora ATCC 24927]EGX53395.1 hypothetical protein AOL_s00006g261 [Orbilia oligospora ATCC 24927]
MELATGIPALVHTAKALIIYANDIKNTPKEWEEILAHIRSLKYLLEKYESGHKGLYGEAGAPRYLDDINLRPRMEEAFAEIEKKIPQKREGMKGKVYHWLKRAEWPVISKKDAKDLQDNLHKLETELGIAINVDIEYVSRTVLERARANEILEWLKGHSFGSEQSEMQSDLQTKMTTGTGTHLLQSKELKEWLTDGEPSKAFWCRGVRGAGKSTQISAVIRNLESKWREGVHSNERAMGCTYFYITPNCLKDLTASKIIITLLLQLLNQVASGDSDPNKASFPQAIIDLAGPSVRSGRIPLRQELTKAFIESAECQQFPNGVFFAIDNLHLLPVQDRSDRATDLIEGIYEFLTEVQRSTRIKLLLCSGNAYMNHFLGDTEDIKPFELAATPQDLKVYMNHKIEGEDPKATRFRADLRQEEGLTKEMVIEELIAKSDKSFLLPALQMKELFNSSRASSISDVLKSLPPTFLDIYQADLSKIRDLQPEESLRAKIAISWAYFARRNLSAYELECAVNFGRANHGGNLPRRTNTIKIDKILDWCQGLLILSEDVESNGEDLILGGSTRVQFVHSTVYELLRDQLDLIQRIEGDIARECITYINEADLTEIVSDDVSSRGWREAKARKYGLLSYSAEMWGFHANRANNSEIDDLALQLLQQESKLEILLDKLPKGVSTYSEEDLLTATGFHVAIHFNYLRVAKLMVDKGLGQINPETTVQTFEGDIIESKTPLMWAIISEAKDVSEWLIQTGANLNIKIENWSPLHWAIAKGKYDIAKLLLDNGADPNLQTSDKNETPLVFAAILGLLDISKLLVSYGASITAHDIEYMTVAHHAARAGQLPFLQWAIDQGCDPQAKANGNTTTLSVACYQGHTKVASYLLKLQKYPAEELSALLDWPVQKGHIEVVCALLVAGADTNYPAHGGWVKNQRASDGVGTSQGVDDEPCYWTPLQRVSRNCNIGMMQLLLNYGASISEKSGGEWDSKGWVKNSLGTEHQKEEGLELLERWEREHS